MAVENYSVFNSILDNDFYKFTMQCAVVQLFPTNKGRYTFINRGKHEFPEGFAGALQQGVNAMAQLKLTKDEKLFLQENCPYLSPLYLDFLEGYRYDPSEVKIEQRGADLEVHVEGYWYRTILWEVPLLAMISELYYRLTKAQGWSDERIVENTLEKVRVYNELNVAFAEFGTRRRHSYHVHDIVMRTLTNGAARRFAGSSNVHFAMKYQVKPIGTHAHEWFMFHAAEYSYKMSNALSLEHWVDVYRGDLGVALSDTYTTDVFFKQFDKKFSKLFDGVRHDSGDPIVFAEKTIAHYKRMGIDPLSKYIIFSDGLNTEKVQLITEACRGKIGLSFGIGTDLTNDVGLRPMNIVMKLTEVLTSDNEWVPTVKLSDEPNKHTGDKRMIELAKGILNISV
ncbi:nicotinate phosphoribosyltransferase [Capnocytophaga haemolytica]|uniref:Nicotinate phosphoribosyltransferase n=1 Tax=Capnocytophaga haemolytica TaxID=45243 RepID=A0AAX2H101_9FLAO|nr:nicotinate phosphoribosyltransferase [Capnocytophaga haemolytica]AMD86030.1 nicotinate phosphoribosyltransferase [Capnocytophaga haemolytica]SFO16585.1 nicotinate phosphoribosyltransferase [Capnocytophaga haemolytica]SNV14668.1 Nicotinate phosphoribosyltransferase 2 [Capnocytophaga haemolytica]